MTSRLVKSDFGLPHILVVEMLITAHFGATDEHGLPTKISISAAKWAANQNPT